MEEVTGFYPVRDGRWIYFQCNFAHLRDAAARVLGVAPTREAVASACLSQDGRELEERLFAGGAVAPFVRTPDEWEAEPQAKAVAELPLIEITKIGEAPPEPLRNHQRPLGGLRVLDLTRLIAGPYCARTLAEHGADVLKVTCADLPDSGGPIEFDSGMGKLTTFLDLRKPGDLSRLLALAQQADVFSQAYRPGSLAARGLAPETLAELRPGIVYASMSAWGHKGPWSGRRGFDSVVQAATGISVISGNRMKPGQLPVSALDYLGGYLLGLGTIVALRRRATEGGSWHVRVSLAGTARWLSDLGLLSAEDIVGLPKGFPPEEIDRLSTETLSVTGIIRHLKPTVQLSETPAGWERPPAPPGHHPPAWPDR
jgi:crotonobetainyl-CoA:carnitine CoA-transferase CaiB-like acyl-CoA transferase